MSHKFDKLGVMIDCSRNAVMTPSMLKSYLPILRKMGYNCVLLYTEDTYYVEGEPYFGYMRGRYTASELREIDGFAASIGMEMIPCIQTLAHLSTTLRWSYLPVDCNDILLTDDERTYEFIDNCFKSLSESLRSRLIHIGMDEAWMLGRGRHMDIHGPESIGDIMKRHLARVMEIAEKYGYHVMLWSDMFVRAFNDGRYYVKEKTVVPDEIISALPKSAIPVYWDYYGTDETAYDVNFDVHRQMSANTWFAGGAWTWTGFVPHNSFSIGSMRAAIRSARRNKIKNIFMTMWGDDGSECSKLAALPSLFAISKFAKGNEDMELIKARFGHMFGISFDDFMLLEELDYVDTPEETRLRLNVNPSKYMLYSDCFNGFLDITVKGTEGEKYGELAVRLFAISKKSRKLGYIFATASRLASALELKYDLGYRTRRAYQSGDREELRRLADSVYPETERRVRAFGDAFEKQWFRENHPGGFDVQDIRIGAVTRRLSSCRRRISDYLCGRVDRIPELEEQLLSYHGCKPGESRNVNRFTEYMTVNSQW